MALQHILLQKLERRQHNGDIQRVSRDSCNAVDGPVYSVFEQARNALQRSASKQIGSFDNSSEHTQLIGLTQNWFDRKQDFLQYSQHAAQLLQQQFLASEEPFSHILLTALEERAEQQYLYILCLNEEDVISTGNDLEPINSRRIVADKLSFGLCLNLTEWQQEHDCTTYLTLLRGRGNKMLSEAFLRFSSFCQRIDNSQQTQAFLTVVDSFSEQLPSEQSQPVKSAILDYCINQDKIGQPVSIRELSNYINEKEPAQFAQFVKLQHPAADDTVFTHRPSLKRYMRYFGRDHSLSISFNADRIDQDIVYEPISGTLSIKKLPKSLKQQLSGFAEKDTQTL